MKKSINEIFRECAEAEGLCSYMYARIAEANYLMDDVKQYPVLLRQFNETISETRMSDMRRRTTTLYFCDALGKAEPDTETEVQPIVEKMEERAFAFINRLRSMGLEVELVSNATPFYGKFDALVAGVTLSATITYNIC
ncbi:hypothetical protein [Alistipes putredinis]|jgi:hypothetical protein|uniref:hypothetical protein n=1 Tax=Alistipes putredinis TaxID=28117 RepID=UPI003A85009B